MWGVERGGKVPREGGENGEGRGGISTECRDSRKSILFFLLSPQPTATKTPRHDSHASRPGTDAEGGGLERDPAGGGRSGVFGEIIARRGGGVGGRGGGFLGVGGEVLKRGRGGGEGGWGGGEWVLKREGGEGN